MYHDEGFSYRIVSSSLAKKGSVKTNDWSLPPKMMSAESVGPPFCCRRFHR